MTKKEKNFPFWKKFVKSCNILRLLRLILGERMENTLEQDIEEIYNKYYDLVFAHIFCKCHNKSLAEEIAQETFYIATKEIKNFRNDCKIELWLRKIARNLWYKELKRMKKAKIISMDTEIGEIEDKYDMEEDFIESEQKAEMYNEIDKLDDTRKELMYLKLTKGLTFKEIAPVLGKSENWTRVTFYRCKEEITKKIKRKEEQ